MDYELLFKAAVLSRYDEQLIIPDECFIKARSVDIHRFSESSKCRCIFTAKPKETAERPANVTQHSNDAEPAEIAVCQCCGKPVQDQAMFCSEVCARTGGQQLRHC